MSKPLLIIKLGGSVITDKESFTPKVRLGTVKQLSRDIFSIYKEARYGVVLVHGAGSYGHPIVKKHSLHKGMTNNIQKLAYSQTVQNMLELNGILVQNLIENSVPAVSLPPHTFTTNTKGKFRGLDTKLIEMYLKNDQVPTLFGDAVLDKDWGCSILSCDTIVSYLARRFKAEKVVFLSDVDGVFTNDPKKDPNAKLIPLISNQNLGSVLKALKKEVGLNKRADVTGEIYGKILSLKKNLKGIQVLITNGLMPNSLINALQNKGKLTKLHFT